jgi:hypothetical protein
MFFHYAFNNIPPEDLIRPHPAPYAFEVYFTSTSRFSNWSLTLKLFNESFALVFHNLHACYLSYPPQIHGFYTAIIFSMYFQLCSLHLYNFPKLRVFPSDLGPNILLDTLFWNDLNPFHFLRARDRMSHTKEQIICCYIVLRFRPIFLRKFTKKFRYWNIKLSIWSEKSWINNDFRCILDRFR